MDDDRVLTAYMQTGDRPDCAGTGFAQLAFCSDAPTVQTLAEQSLGVFLIHLVRDVVPADEAGVEQVLAMGDVSAHVEATEPMLDQLKSVVSNQPFGHGALPFDIEPAWARVVGKSIANLTRRTPSMATVVRARRTQITRIVDRYASDQRLTPVTLAAAINVSRRTLYDLTGNSHGGISEYIRTTRVRGAIQLLLDPELDALTLGQVARRSGFSSAKHLSRALTVLFDTSPAAVRRDRSHPPVARRLVVESTVT